MYTHVPFHYDYINTETSRSSPSTVHVKNTALAQFFQKYLLEKAMGTLEWELPKHWAKNYFLYTLYCFGYVSVIRTNKFGIIPQACGLKGYNVMYQPTHAVISNPLLRGILEPKIGSQCTVIKLQPNYSSIMDIVSFYADMLAICAETAGMNLFNSRLSYVFFAKNKSQAETSKTMFDDIASGNPAVVIDSSMKNAKGENNWELFDQNVRNNYIAGEVLEDMRKIEQMFLTQVGINNSNTTKKERQSVDEINSNNDEVKTLLELWFEELEEGCKETRELFGINDFNVKMRRRVENGIGQYDNVNSRAVEL